MHDLIIRILSEHDWEFTLRITYLDDDKTSVIDELFDS